MAVRAVFWEEEGENSRIVRCRACAHSCRLPDGASGRCRVRVNREGVVYSLSSGHLAAVNLDPVEKKPLFHFLPGTTTLSFGTPGCNMTCAFCQNHSLSQGAVPAFETPLDALPRAFADRAVASALSAGAASVSFTYNEPLVSPELILRIAPQAREAGLAAILVSNAFADKDSLAALRDSVGAVNFDLKSFRDDFYRDVCGARLAPVLRTIEQAVAFGWWVEITTLLIPGLNDSDEELASIAKFIKNTLGAHVPWHVSRFRPMYRMTKTASTPMPALERAVNIGLAEGLFFVYAGNIPGHDAENTRCPGCGTIAIPRVGYRTDKGFDGTCRHCGFAVAGVWRNQ